MMEFDLRVLTISHKDFNSFQATALRKVIEKKIQAEGKKKAVTINIQFFHEKGESHQEGEGEKAPHENAKKKALDLILKYVNNYENLDKPMVLLLEANFGNEAGEPIFDQDWFESLKQWNSRIKVIMFHNSTNKAPELKITNIQSEQLVKMYWTDKATTEDSNLRNALMDEFTNSLINDIEKVLIKKDSSERSDSEQPEDKKDKRYELNKSESANYEHLDVEPSDDDEKETYELNKSESANSESLNTEGFEDIDEEIDPLTTDKMKRLINPPRKFLPKSNKRN